MDDVTTEDITELERAKAEVAVLASVLAEEREQRLTWTIRGTRIGIVHKIVAGWFGLCAGVATLAIFATQGWPLAAVAAMALGSVPVGVLAAWVRPEEPDPPRDIETITDAQPVMPVMWALDTISDEGHILTLSKKRCDECTGTGSRDDGATFKCWTCGGTGTDYSVKARRR